MNRSFLIVEDHLLFAQALTGLISTIGGLECAGIITRGLDLETAIEAHSPDLIILDINLPDVNGIQLLSQIRKNGVETPVLIISMLVDSMIVKKAADSGANGFVPKNTSMEELKTAISKILNGETFYSGLPDLKIDSHLQSSDDLGANSLKELSTREIEILTLIAQGLNNKEISEKLFISPLTVKTHRANIIRKLDLKNTAAIVHFASKVGII